MPGLASTLVFFAIVVLAVPPEIEAHPLLQDPVWVVFSPDKIRVRAQASVREIQLVSHDDSPASDRPFAERVEPLCQNFSRYWLQHFSIKADGTVLTGACVGRAVPPAAVRLLTTSQRENVRIVFDFEFPLKTPSKQLEFSHHLLDEIEYAPGQPWLFTYFLGLKYADSEHLENALLARGAAYVCGTKWGNASLPAKAHGSTFPEFFGHGVWHILTGYDHLLFVSALILAATSFWQLFKVIGAFTIAHSLTLVLSALNIFRLPEWFVEPVIAASIVFVAVENVIFPQRALGWSRLAIAFVFGLVHGLGFAGGLLDALAEMPAVSLTLAILGFSLGVEAAHQIVMVPMYRMLAFARHRARIDIGANVLKFGSAAVSVSGLFYLVLAVETFVR